MVLFDCWGGDGLGNIPNRCPVCSGEMEVRLLRCSCCDTEIQGSFLPGRFERLSDEQMVFLETFVKLRGSLKDLCAELGISYPTARNRLDSLIETLGFDDFREQTQRRLAVLERLKNGELTAQEALDLLQKR